MKFFECVLDIIFPQKCGICGKVGGSICDKCYENLKKYEIKRQHEDLFFVYQYEGELRKLILDYKFNDKSYLYKTFAKCLIKNKNVCQFLNCYDIIIPVPLHKKRLHKRGYNQAELVARELSKELTLNNRKILCLSNALIKNKNIKPQSEKGIAQRKADIKGIYEVKNANSIKNKKVILFDDIYTTGSTAEECKKMLLEAGVSKVGILTIAKDYIE